MRDMMDMKDCGAAGCNAGMGNRAVADNIKGVHMGHSSDWTSSRVKPARSIAHAPGASSSVLKTPRATSRPIDS